MIDESGVSWLQRSVVNLALASSNTMNNSVSHCDTKIHVSSVSTNDESTTFSVPWKQMHPCYHKSRLLVSTQPAAHKYVLVCTVHFLCSSRPDHTYLCGKIQFIYNRYKCHKHSFTAFDWSLTFDDDGFEAILQPHHVSSDWLKLTVHLKCVRTSLWGYKHMANELGHKQHPSII